MSEENTLSQVLSDSLLCTETAVCVGAADKDTVLSLPFLPLDTMENWDEKKLEEVVNKKHGEAEKKKPKTQIVCSFLELSGLFFRDNLVARCLLLFGVVLRWGGR